MVVNIILFVFASFIIQDAVSFDQVPKDARVGDTIAKSTTLNNLTAANNTDQQPNEGKIWNWSFASTGDGTFPANPQKQSASKLNPEQFNRESKDDSSASASGFKKSFLRKAAVPYDTKPRRPVNIKNLDRLRDGMLNKMDDEYDSVDSDYDSEDSVSFDSRDESFDDSQSYGSSQFDDDSIDDEYLKLPQGARINQNHPSNYPIKRPLNAPQKPFLPSVNAPQQPFLPSMKEPKLTKPIQAPTMQVRSLPMRTNYQTRSLQMRGSPIRRYGRDSQGI